MSIFDNLLQRFGYYKQATPGDYSKTPSFLLDMASGQRYNMPALTTTHAQAELMARLSWVYTAIAYTANYAACTPLNVYKLKGEKTVDVPNHDFENLMYRPNPSQSRFDLLNATFAYLRLNGNCYWWLNRSDEKAKPDEIWVLPPYRVQPIPDGKMYISGYEYDSGLSKVEPLPTWQVAHFRAFNPTHEFVGLSGVEPIATIAAGDLGLQKFTAKLFTKSNGRLPGVLAFGEYIQEPMWQGIKDGIKDASDNREYMLLRGVGKGGVELIATPTPKDMETLGMRAFTKEEIYNVFAPGLSSVLAVNATEANARTGKATLTDFAIWPMMEQVAQVITNTILPSYGSANITYRAGFDDIRITDRAITLREQEEYAKTHTVNEIRDEYYSDDPLKDERGDMLPSQVGPNSGMQEPEPVVQPSVVPQVVSPVPAMNPEGASENTGESMEENMMSAETKADIARWRRKAMNAVKNNKPANVSFSSEHIPAQVCETIGAALQVARTPEDVTAAFAHVETVTKQTGEFDEVIAVIRDALKAIDDEK